MFMTLATSFVLFNCYATADILTKFYSNASCFLAHLSPRLIGELIVYEGIRRPSVRRSSVCQHFQTISPLKP